MKKKRLEIIEKGRVEGRRGRRRSRGKGRGRKKESVRGKGMKEDTR